MIVGKAKQAGALPPVSSTPIRTLPLLPSEAAELVRVLVDDQRLTAIIRCRLALLAKQRSLNHDEIDAVTVLAGGLGIRGMPIWAYAAVPTAREAA